jgi:hypothetical protein
MLSALIECCGGEIQVVWHSCFPKFTGVSWMDKRKISTKHKVGMVLVRTRQVQHILSTYQNCTCMHIHACTCTYCTHTYTCIDANMYTYTPSRIHAKTYMHVPLSHSHTRMHSCKHVQIHTLPCSRIHANM